MQLLQKVQKIENLITSKNKEEILHTLITLQAYKESIRISGLQIKELSSYKNISINFSDLSYNINSVNFSVSENETLANKKNYFSYENKKNKNSIQKLNSVKEKKNYSNFKNGEEEYKVFVNLVDSKNSEDSSLSEISKENRSLSTNSKKKKKFIDENYKLLLNLGESSDNYDKKTINLSIDTKEVQNLNKKEKSKDKKKDEKKKRRVSQINISMLQESKEPNHLQVQQSSRNIPNSKSLRTLCKLPIKKSKTFTIEDDDFKKKIDFKNDFFEFSDMSIISEDDSMVFSDDEF